MSRTLLSLRRPVVMVALIAGTALAVAARTTDAPLDRDAQRWLERTLKTMSLDDKVGQLLMPSFDSTYTSTDSEAFDRLARLVKAQRVGGFVLSGGTEPAPSVLLNPAYGSVILGQPLAAASITNRLQQLSAIPMLNAGDFEWGVGMRVAHATSFPRAMAFGAANDERLTYEAGRIMGREARAIGIHVNFGPVADVNNNPRNPVINTRSFGEDPARVGALAAAYSRGLHEAGVLATLKHFPGHGDTDVDSHLGLPVIKHPRERLEQTELAPFRTAIAAGADAVMIAHIELPALDPTPNTPATLSRPIVTDYLRNTMKYEGLVYTDSMSMLGVTKLMAPGEAAVRAVRAGNDIVLHSPDDQAAFDAIKAAVEKGEIDRAQVDRSVTRILTAKARLGLPRQRLVDLNEVSNVVGTRASAAVADEVSRKSITLIKDDTNSVPLTAPNTASVLYLSVLDYPSGWRIAAPSGTFLPELRKRFSDVTAIELSDRTTPDEVELVRATASRFDVVVTSVFVRTASFSGRMDLVPGIVRLLQDVARASVARQRPFVTVFFGNPYVATFLPELPSVLLTYDFYGRAEASAVRAITGEAPISGRLPIGLPGLFPVGHGLDRTARTATAMR